MQNFFHGHSDSIRCLQSLFKNPSEWTTFMKFFQQESLQLHCSTLQRDRIWRSFCTSTWSSASRSRRWCSNGATTCTTPACDTCTTRTLRSFSTCSEARSVGRLSQRNKRCVWHLWVRFPGTTKKLFFPLQLNTTSLYLRVFAASRVLLFTGCGRLVF